MKSDRDRGPLGVWLLKGRLARGWTPEEAPVEILRLTGHKVSRSWLSALEGGSRHQIGKGLQAALEAVYGPAPAEAVVRRLTQEERLAEAVYKAVLAALRAAAAEGTLEVRAPRRQQR